MKKKIRFDEPQKTVKIEVPNQKTGFGGGFIFGAVAGMAGLWLYGTKKGRQVKKYLAGELKKLGEEAVEIKEKLSEEPIPSKKPLVKPKPSKKNTKKTVAK